MKERENYFFPSFLGCPLANLHGIRRPAGACLSLSFFLLCPIFNKFFFLKDFHNVIRGIKIKKREILFCSTITVQSLIALYTFLYILRILLMIIIAHLFLFFWLDFSLFFLCVYSLSDIIIRYFQLFVGLPFFSLSCRADVPAQPFAVHGLEMCCVRWPLYFSLASFLSVGVILARYYILLAADWPVDCFFSLDWTPHSFFSLSPSLSNVM